MRSFFLLFMVFIFSLSLSLGSLFLHALDLGLDRVGQRMGADLLVVPSGYKANLESLLLKGEPSTFYLPAQAANLLKEQAGIEQYTPQLYLATLSASCCSYPVQIIGFDPESDFLVQAWLRSNLRRDLQDGEALVGASIVGEAGESLHFFNEPLSIAGRLDKTGMGFDATVFVNMATAKRLAEAGARMGVQEALAQSQASVYLVKVKKGLDPAKVASQITKTYGAQGLFAMVGQAFIQDLAHKVDGFGTLVRLLLIMLWLMATLLLGLSFRTLVQTREREWATLRILGASLRQLRHLVLIEALQLSLRGALMGTALGLAVAFLALPGLSARFLIPLPSPSIATYALIGLLSFGLGLLIAPLASLPAVLRMSRREAYISLREGEAC